MPNMGRKQSDSSLQSVLGGKLTRRAFSLAPANVRNGSKAATALRHEWTVDIEGIGPGSHERVLHVPAVVDLVESIAEVAGEAAARLA